MTSAEQCLANIFLSVRPTTNAGSAARQTVELAVMVTDRMYRNRRRGAQRYLEAPFKVLSFCPPISVFLDVRKLPPSSYERYTFMKIPPWTEVEKARLVVLHHQANVPKTD